MKTKRYISFILPILPGIVVVSLLVMLLSACAFVGPIYAQAILLTENFDAPWPPNLPNGWNITDVSGTQGNWTTIMDTWHPEGYQAHSLPNMAVFNSYTTPAGNSTRLFRTIGINLSNLIATLTFWMFHDGQYSSSNDTVQPQVSVDGGLTWDNAGSAISRYIAGTYAWSQHTVDLSAYLGQTDVRIGFLGTSAFGNDCYIDDVEVNGVDAGALEGTVTEVVTSLPINGATIQISGPSSQTTTTNGSGFYIFPSLPAGSYSVTASRSGYLDGVATGVIVLEDYITTQDFVLMPAGGMLQFSSETYSVNENVSSVLITVTRTGGNIGVVEVSYATSNGSATAGSDYTSKSGILSWANGDTADKTFSVTILDDSTYEGNETVNLTLGTPKSGAILGFPTTAVLTILENDLAPLKILRFSSASYSVDENGGGATITVTRMGGSSGEVGVSYATSDGSAISGLDYTYTSGTLSWANGDMSDKTFTVPILDNSTFESSETINLTLSNPTGGAILGSPSTSVLTIIDNDPLIKLFILTLNVNPAAAGSITKNPDKVAYVNGDSVQLTANPNSGYNFINWSGDVIGNTNPISFIMNSNKSVTANFSTIPGNNIIFVSLDGTCNGYIPCFSSIQSAIGSAGTYATIIITQETYVENVILNTPKILTLLGGWDPTFTNCLSTTTINGSLTIRDGTLIIENIILQ